MNTASCAAPCGLRPAVLPISTFSLLYSLLTPAVNKLKCEDGDWPVLALQLESGESAPCGPKSGTVLRGLIAYQCFNVQINGPQGPEWRFVRCCND